MTKYFLMKQDKTSPLETLTEIRQLMERSSRFISLSGLSGVFAGVYALAGAYAAYDHLNLQGVGYFSGRYIVENPAGRSSTLTFLIADAAVVLILAVGTGIFLTTRKAKQDGNSIFDVTAKKLILNLSIPLVAGGMFCLALNYHNAFIFVAPAMLVFYGLALVHASKYTRNDIRMLGFAEIALGLIASFFVGYGLLFWALGFGVLHIFYGTYMYFKYEK
jgi:predicted lysophospholipase L1 biosynthesis ABC-type transport system permease subunit